MIRESALQILTFLSQTPAGYSPSRNGQDGVKIRAVTMDIVAMFHFRK